MTKSKFSITVLIFISLITGFFLGFFFNRDAPSSGPGNEELLRQIETAKAYFPTIPEMFSVSGTVEGIRGDTITIKTFQNPNPFEDLPQTRDVIVTESTKIVKKENKDQEVYQKEFEEFNKKLSEQTVNSAPEPLTPPDPFVEKAIGISEIKLNNQINIDAGKNIKALKSFEAVKIAVQLSVPRSAPAEVPSVQPSDAGLPAPPPIQKLPQLDAGPPAPP